MAAWPLDGCNRGMPVSEHRLCNSRLGASHLSLDSISHLSFHLLFQETDTGRDDRDEELWIEDNSGDSALYIYSELLLSLLPEQASAFCISSWEYTFFFYSAPRLEMVIVHQQLMGLSLGGQKLAPVHVVCILFLGSYDLSATWTPVGQVHWPRQRDCRLELS